jgi:hypothetical protein
MRPEVGDRVPAAEAVVAEALQAFEAQKWSRLIALTDADSLASLQTNYLIRKREMERLRAESMPDVSLHELPPAFAEYLANRKTFGELAGIRSFEEVEALGTHEFLIRWAQARHPEYLVDGEASWNTDTLPIRRVTVGSVAILPDTAAVVVRATGSVAINALATLSMIAVLGDNRGGWYLDAATGWLGLTDWYV